MALKDKSSPTGGAIPSKEALQPEMLTTAEKKVLAASASTRRPNKKQPK